MGPLLSAAKSIGKEFLVEKAADLLSGKDKEVNNELNEVQTEVPVEEQPEPETVENEYYSANDDNPAMNDTDSEGNLPESEFSADAIPVTIPDNDGVDKYNKDDLKPLKLEQPYSVIRMRNDGDDPNKLKSWERPPHNSSKITKDNLNDAMAVNNVFKDSIDSGNSLQAPEGNNNDYFLKAKNNLVGRQNDRNIGSFLNQFHGMDFFKRGVPEIEKELKGTGYDMGPSANNIVDNLKEAVDKGDTEEVENIIEEHPVESQEALPEDTPIQEEAKQITDDTNKANDEVNNEVVEDFVEEPSAESELSPVGYTTEQVADPNVGSIPEDLPENNRPLDNFVLNNYDDDKDRGELSPAIESNNDNKDGATTETGTDLPKGEDDDFEAYARKAGEEAGDRKQLEKEHAEAFEEKLRHNNQQAWKDYALEKSKLNTRGSIRKGFENEVGKSILAEIMTPEEWMNDSLREGVLRHTTYTSNPVEVRNRLRESIAKEKKALGIDEETLKANAEEEKKRRDEAWAKLMATNNPNKDDKAKDNKKKGSIDWDKVRVYEPGEDPYSKVSDESDWINNPDYEPNADGADVYLHHDDDFAGPDELPATIDQIRDEDFVGPDEQLAIYNGGVPEEIYLDPIYDTSDYNFDWDYDIQTLGVASPEEIPDAPVHNKEQAKAKQRLMNWFKSKHLDQSSKSGPVESTPSAETSNRLSMAGRRAGALSLPASGSGSVPSASMGKGVERQPGPYTSNSIASKAPLPVALEDNQGREVSVNGKATTMPVSGKNGSMRSGSFGLMSKPSKNTKVGKPVGAISGGAYHTQSNGSMKSKQVSGIGQVATDGKDVLIERIRTLLKELPEEEVSKLGFSPVRNTYKGKSLEQYDGYTLQNLIKQLEAM